MDRWGAPPEVGERRGGGEAAGGKVWEGDKGRDGIGVGGGGDVGDEGESGGVRIWS